MPLNETALIPPEFNNSYQYLKWLETQAALDLLPTFVVLATLVVVGVVGNFLTLYVYYTRFNPSSTRTYILMMSIFDLLFCVLSLPGDIMDLRFSLTYEASWLCRLYKMVTIFLTLVSGLLLVVVAVIRRRKVCHPFKRQLNATHVNRSVVICVVLAAVFSIPFGVMNGHNSVPTGTPGVVGVACSVDDAFLTTHFPIVYNGLLCLVFVGCCAAMITSYVQIAHTILQHKRSSARSLRESSSSRDTSGSLKGKDRSQPAGQGCKRADTEPSSKGDDTSHVEEQSHYDEEFHEEVLQSHAVSKSEKRKSSRVKPGAVVEEQKHKADLEQIERTQLLILEREQGSAHDTRESAALQQTLLTVLTTEKTSTLSLDKVNEGIDVGKERAIVIQHTFQPGDEFLPLMENTQQNHNITENNANAKEDDDDVFISQTNPEVYSPVRDRPDSHADQADHVDKAERVLSENLQQDRSNSFGGTARPYSLKQSEEELDLGVRALIHTVSDDMLAQKDAARRAPLLPDGQELGRRSLSDGGRGKSRSASAGDEYFHLSQICEFIKDQSEDTAPCEEGIGVQRDHEVIFTSSQTGGRQGEDERWGVNITVLSGNNFQPQNLAPATDLTKNGDIGCKVTSSESPTTPNLCAGAPQENSLFANGRSLAEGENETQLTHGDSRKTCSGSSQESAAIATTQSGRFYTSPRKPVARTASKKSTSSTPPVEGGGSSLPSKSQPPSRAARLLSSTSEEVGKAHATRLYSSTSVASRSERLQSLVQRSLRRFRSSTPSEEDDSAASSSLRRRHSRKKIPSRTTWMMFVLAAIFVVSYLPYLTINGVRATKHDIDSGLSGWRLNLYTLALKSYFINAVVNPIVYSFCSARFRHQCRNILLCGLRKPMST